MNGPPPMVGVRTKRNNRLLENHDHPITVDAVKALSRTQREALGAIAFFRRQRKVGRSWLVGDKRVSEKLVERLGGDASAPGEAEEMAYEIIIRASVAPFSARPDQTHPVREEIS